MVKLHRPFNKNDVDPDFRQKWAALKSDCISVAMDIWFVAGAHSDRELSRRDRHQIELHARNHMTDIVDAMAAEGVDGWRSPKGAWRGSYGEYLSLEKEPTCFHGDLHRACRLAFAIAGNEPTNVTPQELALLKTIIGDDEKYGPVVARMKLRPPAPSINLNPGESVLAEVSFVWRKMRGRFLSSCLTKGETGVQIHAVSASEAPVVARLAKPQEGTLDIRMINGVYYRPVLAPQSWRDITLGECMAALKDGCAWLDNPATVWGHAMAHEDIDDLAAPTGALAPSDSERMTREAEVVGRRCSGLISIDGIVHRPCPEPRIEIRVIWPPSGKPPAPRLAWSIGDLLSTSRQESLPPSRVEPTYYAKASIGIYGPVSFPLDKEAFARNVVDRWRSLEGSKPIYHEALCIDRAPMPESSACEALSSAFAALAERPKPHRFKEGLSGTFNLTPIAEMSRHAPEGLADAARTMSEILAATYGRKPDGKKSDQAWDSGGCFALALCEAIAEHEWAPAPNSDEDLDAMAEGFAP